MTLLRRTYGDLPNFSNWLEDFFSKEIDMFGRSKYTIPSVNIIEKPDSYLIEVAAPGLTKEDFELNLEHNVLTISSQKECKVEEKEENYTKREFCYSSFQRSFTLPETANPENINAKYDAGILTITIAKRDEAKVKPVRKINIG